jgi:hypothetical protein
MIVYGTPDPALERAVALGEVVLGGCIVTRPHRWRCRTCGYEWPLPDEALESKLVREAFELAAAARRAAPGPEHPAEVAHMLYEEGYAEEVLAAALLHDVMEHACIGFCELEMRFGYEVASLIEALTPEQEIRDHDKRTLVHRARITASGRRAAAIYAADRLATLRELRAEYDCEGELLARQLDASLDELMVNADRDIRMLERSNPPLPFVDELKEELAAMRSDRAAGRRKDRDLSAL